MGIFSSTIIYISLRAHYALYKKHSISSLYRLLYFLRPIEPLLYSLCYLSRIDSISERDLLDLRPLWRLLDFLGGYQSVYIDRI